MIKIPERIKKIIFAIEDAGFEAYLVGGCVRDWILNKEPKDWDVATNALPEEILAIFPKGKYENNFGTVLIPEKYLSHKTEKVNGIVEVTTYRAESCYSDFRHPDRINFVKNLEDDLGRRDFTINAMAVRVFKKNNDFEIIDLYSGRLDLKNKLIRAVGKAQDRFNEDALRMMRAVRFSSQLNFKIEENTFLAIKKNARALRKISQERIRDEFIKIIQSENPSKGVDNLRKTGLLNIFLPELLEGFNVKQNHHHIFTVYQHNLLSLKYCPSNKLEVRLAALFHDIAKPRTKIENKETITFYNHDSLGERMTKKILNRLKFPKDIIEKTSLLIANHMFYYNVGEVTEASVRRLIARVGLENMRDLIDLRVADRLGSGVPKAKPYRLRHFEYMIEKVSKDPISVKMLKINGNDLMHKLKIPAGPKIGAILDVLLAEVIEDKNRNKKTFLLKRSEQLKKDDLDNLRILAKRFIDEKKEKDDQLIKGKYWVK